MRKIIVAFIVLLSMLVAGGSAQCAEINQANNTQIIRLVGTGNYLAGGAACGGLPIFTEFWDLYIHGSSNPPPTACTAFIIAPLRYPEDPVRLIPPPAQSSVNLPTLIQAAKVEKVSAVALVFGAQGFAQFTLNIPFSMNITFVDNQGHTVPAPSVIQPTIGSQSAVYLFTQDGGKDWQAEYVQKISTH